MDFYAGIGSRETPPEVLRLMTRLASRLETLGWVLRSGGAQGADAAFARGVHHPEHAEIYLPWEGFGSVEGGTVVGDFPRLREVAERFHPSWERCSRGARALHTRNVAQVLGDSKNSTVSSMVICWTPRGEGGGGTGQAIRIARGYGVPVFDLYFGMDALAEFMRARQG